MEKNKKVIKINLSGAVAVLVVIVIAIFFSSKIFAANDSSISDKNQIKENNTSLNSNGKLIEDNSKPENFEENNNSIDLKEILIQNANVKYQKTVTTELRDTPYTTLKQENHNLPKGEEVVVQPGKIGKEEDIVVKTYQDSDFLEENIINRTIIEPYIEEVIDVGTSDFLLDNKVHIGDMVYTVEDTSILKGAEETAEKLCDILKDDEVKIVEVNGMWVKVTYGEEEGYIKSTNLVSGIISPETAERCRINKLIKTLNIDMTLNSPSGLTLTDFKKVLSDNSQDKNKIFEQNAEVFYNLETKYNINGIFVAAIGINESGWGTSQIAKDKKNLFGYGAYDSDAYYYAYDFTNYSDGIDLVARALIKYYLNEKGTKLQTGELAEATYYNGATVNGVNVRYATDAQWGSKVYNYMDYLYNKLK